MPEIVFKAFGGDRAKNLRAIAEEFEAFANAVTSVCPGELDQQILHKTKGMCEQLRIIAREIEESV